MMQNKVISMVSDKLPIGRPAESFFKETGLWSNSSKHVAKTADGLVLSKDDNVLAIGAGIDWQLLVAFSSAGANVSLAQPRKATSEIEGQIPQTDLLENGLAEALETVPASTKVALGNIDTTSYQDYINNARLPKRSFSVAVLPNIFDIQVDRTKSSFMKKLCFSLMNESKVLFTFYGKSEGRVQVLLSEIRQGLAKNKFIIEEELVFDGSLSFDKTEVYQFNIHRR